MREQLAAALRAKDFENAERISEAFGEQVKAELTAASDQSAREQIFSDAISTLTDNLHLARVLRAHIVAEIHTNLGSIRYDSPDSERHRWQMQG